MLLESVDQRVNDDAFGVVLLQFRGGVMFDKEYFEDFVNRRMDEYFKVYPTGVITVTIKLLWDQEFNLVKVLQAGDHLLTFAFYDLKKQDKLPKRAHEEHGTTAFPVLDVPYSAIRSVEFNPGKASGSKDAAGFRYEK
jgi:hypothetical protein